MIKLRRFEKEDWFGLGGATKFADGSEPYIGEFHLDEADVEGGTLLAMLVIGDECADVMWWDKEVEKTWWTRHAYDRRWSPEDARKLASHLDEVTKLGDLFLLGFSTDIQEC
ncbi:unnamed protein product [marine sediment metagenome]|uniref:Uncharacterized protein n=1 Tax=marine sediment metagenome TaxID=412755 RepID=X0XW41_9ZZZZ